jgi:hypothetical protein
VRTGKDISEHFCQQPNVGCCDHESRMPKKCSVYLWQGKLNACIFRQKEQIEYEIPRLPEAAKLQLILHTEVRILTSKISLKYQHCVERRSGKQTRAPPRFDMDHPSSNRLSGAARLKKTDK